MFLRHEHVCATLAALALSDGNAALEIGDTIPRVTLETSPAEVTIGAGGNRRTHLDFWAVWFTPCKKSFPWMNLLHSKFAVRGLEIVAINVGIKRSDADRFLAHTPPKFGIAFDRAHDVPKRLFVKAMPSAYLVDPKGRIHMIHRGSADEDAASIEREIDSILALK